MELQLEPPGEEIRRLKHCINDLISLLALPAVWAGGDLARIADTLLDALAAMLRVDVVYIRLLEQDDGTPIEMARVAQTLGPATQPRDIGVALERELGHASSTWPSTAWIQIAEARLFAALRPLGLHGEIGVVVAGSRRRDFPLQTEELLLTVAVNQAVVALHEARLLGEQKHLAQDLDRRVAERTRDLAAANAALTQEVAERRRAEDALRRSEEALATSERNFKLIVDTIPAVAWTARPDGSADFFNQHYLDYVGLTSDQAMGWRWTVAVHPDDMPGLAATWEGVRASGKAGEGEARLRRFDGEYRWFLFRANPLRDESGTIARWYGVNTDIDERKRAEVKAIEAESELQQAFDSIPALAATYDADGSRLASNKRGREFTGLAPEDLTNGRWTGAIHPDDFEATESKWRACVASGESFEDEYRTRAADGTYRWFMARRVPVHDEAGKIIRWYGVSHDIEDRKRAETLLGGEKHLLEMIATGSAIRDVLSALCRMVEGAALDCYCDIHLIDWNSSTFEYAVAPSLPPSYSDPVARLPVSGELLPCGIAAHQKVQVVSADIESDPRWYTSAVRSHVLAHGLRAVWSTPICSKNGEVLGTFCVVQRKAAVPSPYHQTLISHASQIAAIAIERSRTEAALRRSETLLSEAQRLSSTGAFSWFVDTDEVAFSEELYRIFEFDPGSVVTLARIQERIHPDDLPSLSTQMARVRSGQSYVGYEIRLRMQDGRVKYLRTFGRAIRHQDERIECLTAVQDVTERRIAEEALSAARSELAHVTRISSLGALTASIAHEVNQPLSGIVTNASTCLRMLGAEPPNVEGARETARRTIRDGNRAAEVIARLRRLFTKRAATIEPVDLNDAAREVIALSAGDLQTSRAVLQTELAADLPLVCGDRVQLLQVVMNLMRNALDAMSGVDDRPRRLLIRTEADGEGCARLVMQDAGTGFGPEGTERLFEAFYSTKSEGMGIGLFVSRSIIESHGGRLWAKANDDGPGATFVFSLPRYVPDRTEARGCGTSYPSATASPGQELI
ncbi:PAS domain-containing protein [Inquilinus sp.]|uniref:PAS domain-containing protein n=1 Tax=Inquilinus sp. TaxID=1932117 RepID=UPI0031E071ED